MGNEKYWRHRHLKIKKVSMFRHFLFVSGLLVAFSVNAVELKSYFEGWHGLQADFEQRVYDADNKLQELSKGQVTISMPSRFKFKYTKPFEQLYLADGEKLWFYDTDLEQVTVSQQKNILAHTPAMILSNPKQLDKHYLIKQLANSDHATAFELTPKQKDSQFETIRLGFIDGKLKHMELRDSFSRITFLEFSNLKKNPGLAKDEFVFVPPKGVDVIQQ
jgi:outer membrane lipoprotein carrier protein